MNILQTKMVSGYQEQRLCGFHDNEIMVHCMLQYYEVYCCSYYTKKTPCNSLIIKILFWRSVHRCYTYDKNTVLLEGWYFVMYGYLLPALSLKMQSYPECIGEVSTRYKTTAAESRMRSRQWELHHCSIVYTVAKIVEVR